MLLFSLPIECAKGLHLYDGRCHIRCPDGTYGSEVLMERSSRRRNLTYFSEPVGLDKRDGLNVSKLTATEALDMEPLSDAKRKSPLVCLPCHYTCATCSGPRNSQCLSCLDDAQLFSLSNAETTFYCYPNTAVPQINNAHWHYKLNVVLGVILSAFGLVGLYIFVTFIIKRFGCFSATNYSSNIKVAYNKLAVDDKYQSALEIEDEIQKAIKYSTDSESEDDVHS